LYKEFAVSVVRVGATKTYSDNWDSIFSRGPKQKTKLKAKPAASAKKKPASKKPVAKGKKSR
jgi:hypothetical protein